MSSAPKLEEVKEANKEEIQKILKQNIIKIFKQIKNGCPRKICYNIYCGKNLICKQSKYFIFFIIIFFNKLKNMKNLQMIKL